MPTATSWKRRAIGGALLLAGLAFAWALPFGPRPVVSRWLFPQEVPLFVMDGRVNGDFTKDLERVYPPSSQRRDGVRVVVHRVSPDQVLRSSAELFDTFERTRSAVASAKLFIELAAPYRCSKKVLRQEIDLQQRFKGSDRRDLMRATVPIIGARASAPDEVCSPEERPHGRGRDACANLKDDWAYMKWNFGGLGLKVDAQTMDRVGQCLARAIVESMSPSTP